MDALTEQMQCPKDCLLLLNIMTTCLFMLTAIVVNQRLLT
jgi:hypothetical protein